jgi:hypothetical protein
MVSNEFVELPGRRIVLLEENWSEGIDPNNWLPSNGVDGALVRFRYRVRQENLHLVDETVVERALLAAGAHEVTIEAVLVHEARIRSEEIVSARTTWEKVLAFWQAKGIDPDEATRERVRAKLASIEAGEEVARAAA